MANKTFLTLTNEVLGELNEVNLTSDNFVNASGIQKFAKDALSRAYFDIANENPEFPWLSMTASGDSEEYGNTFVDTVAGTRWYTLRKHSSGTHGTAKDFAKVDWDNFYLTTEDVGSCSSVGVCSNASYSTAATCIAASHTWTDYDSSSVCIAASGTWTATHTSPHTRQNLKFIPIEVWKKFHRESDDSAKDTGVYSQPTKIIMSPDGQKFGVSPLPDKAYRIYFYAWEQAEPFTLHGDEVRFPEQWTSVLLAKARYYIWHFKENIELANLGLEEYRKGIRLMRAHTGKPQPSVMTDDRIRFV